MKPWAGPMVKRRETHEGEQDETTTKVQEETGKWKANENRGGDIKCKRILARQWKMST